MESVWIFAGQEKKLRVGKNIDCCYDGWVYKVLKKDGSVQDFDWKKVTNGVLLAGGDQEDADKVAAEVELWLSTVADDGVIKSYDLHVKVLDILQKVNPVAGKRFEGFRKPDPQTE